MTVFEVEQQHDRPDVVAELAAYAPVIAAELGQDPASVAVVLGRYFRHTDPTSLADRSAEDLRGLVTSHYRLTLQRPAARAAIDVSTPNARADGSTAGGATIVQIVTDDHPFLVDSVTMEVTRQGWSVREVFHPQFGVRRTVQGALQQVVDLDQVEPSATALQESWMHLEILPPARPGVSDTAAADLRDGLQDVLRLVEEAVEDWQKMVGRALEIVDDLTRSGQAPETSEARVSAEAVQAAELLQWLTANHFTFLGYREYRYRDGGYQPVPGTGLGILRADQQLPGAFAALPIPGHRPELLVITKDNHRSRIHRPAYLDYVAVRTLDATGAVTGERRFLGLFASSAYVESVSRVPVVRQKAAAVLARSGYDPHSHGGKAVVDVLESYPRDELFQTSVPELAAVVEKVMHLKERRQVRLFVRRDPYGRYLSCLVYLPRDRYTTAARHRMQDALLRTLNGASVDYTALVSESVLARVHFVVRMPVGVPLDAVDGAALERDLTLATRTWDDAFADEIAGSQRVAELASLVGALPEGYKEDFRPRQAVQDLVALAELPASAGLSTVLYAPDSDGDEADLRLKVFRRNSPLALTAVLPHLSLLGVQVIDERPYALTLGVTERAFVYDFGLKVPGGRASLPSRWSPAARQRFCEALSASYAGRSEADGFQALVLVAELTWSQVTVLRAIGRYLQQAGTAYSQAYLAQALAANVDLARRLIALFEVRFDPDLKLDADARARRAAGLVDQIERALDDVASLDHDRIVRSYLSVLSSMVRTTYYVPGREAVAYKLLPRQIPDLPQPRPAYEVFVYGPRVEGVHLRFGAVARGGLRWSDRAEDYRTEILGLVKAQTVKNSVIVPVGAKGGFYPRHLPDPAVDRDAWFAEGQECYQIFVTSLLQITDNLSGETVVPPERVLRYDGDDPYLVVAADKGTATFSDLANEVAVAAGFWLGDAFASGGSAGYDHKEMGITARGAWESVVRHFRELGVDPQRDDFTCVGIGDMSGDVFGNAMLLSRHTRLVAAFDHRHVFVDPDPDPETSWTERRRLFDLPRSSWADYDPALISAGGGVFARSAKWVPVSEPMRRQLGIDADVTRLSPAELITACLQAPVDLLFNGGIGTYVKAATETNPEVGDKANDALRVNGSQLRARCVGEGGNLGLTAPGRVEYALAGGRINTDFIDNSAGVDTSDHEVNIKILLAPEVAAGRLPRRDRDALLASMTADVAEHVLTHNRDQNLALANSCYEARSLAGVHEAWMERLVETGHLDRQLEALPTSQEMAARRSSHRGLTAPELAVLLAYTKIVLAEEVLASDLPDDPVLAPVLLAYFPRALRERYDVAIGRHRLRREIVATTVVNEFVDRAGITAFSRLSVETGAGPADVIRAHLAARAILAAEQLEDAIGQLDHQIDAATQTRLRLQVRTVVERATRWLLNGGRPIDVAAAVERLRGSVTTITQALPQLLHGRDLEAFSRRVQADRSAGVPEPVAVAVTGLPAAYAALALVRAAERDDLPLLEAAEIQFTLGQRLGLDRLLARIAELPRGDRWQTTARAALRDDLYALQAELTAQVFDGEPVRASPPTAEERVARWERATPAAAEAAQTLQAICASPPDLAKMSVGVRVVRGLLTPAG